MSEQEKKEKKEVVSTSAEQLVDVSNAYTPDVNIYETEDKMVFLFDLPGVKTGDVQVEVDENNVLFVKAKTSFVEPDGIMFRQFNKGDYYRVFSLSDKMDKDKVTGKLENGVLEVVLPKKEAVIPKRIQISA